MQFEYDIAAMTVISTLAAYPSCVLITCQAQW